MRKILTILFLFAVFPLCHAQRYDGFSGLSADDAKTVLEVFCSKYYKDFFVGKDYISRSLLIKSVAVDTANGGTLVSGTHSYQGVFVLFRGRKTHKDVPFTATIIAQPHGYYVIFNKWYEPDLLKRNGEWETGKRLVPFE